LAENSHSVNSFSTKFLVAYAVTSDGSGFVFV